MPEQRCPNTAYTFFSWCSCCEKHLPPSRFLIRFHICRTWKNTKACLTLPRLLGNILWADETEVELFRSFVSCYMWHKTSKAFHNKNMTTAKHGGGDAVWWSEAALLLQDLDDLLLTWYIHEFCSLTGNPEGECPFIPWSSRALRLSSNDMESGLRLWLWLDWDALTSS